MYVDMANKYVTNLIMYAENPKEFNRIYIAYTKQAIVTIIWMGVFCGD